MSGMYSYYTISNKEMSIKLPVQKTDICCTTTLDSIPVGSTCIIDSCALPQSLKLRLEEMGLTRGAEVTVLKVAPLGDPMEICVRGYALCIRKETAKCFRVTKG